MRNNTRPRLPSSWSVVPRSRLLSLLPLLLFFIWAVPAKAKGELFPSYPELRNSVQFWEAIYATHSVNQAVIHDRKDLSKVYEVVQLVPPDQPNADQINRRILKKSIRKYRDILKSLSRGKTPATATEKHVAAMYTSALRSKYMAKGAENLRAQKGLKERFRDGVVTSGGYMRQLRAIFTRKGLPPELAYLPHVESSFNNDAYSKFGAAGMWQFTRSTGKQYLTINDAVDERRDPYVAAEAAARYLKNSYNLLGSWPLALTAYNYGTAGMLRAQKAKGSYVRIHAEYDKGHFGFASRNFYAEFLAALKVAKKLEADPGLHRNKEIAFHEYRLPAYLHIRSIRNHFGISTGELKKFNPALRPSVYSGKKLLPRGYLLRLPRTSTMKNRIAQIPRSLFHNSQTRDNYYRVRNGDTASGIAARHKVKLKELIQLNHLDRKATIFVGQKLRLPHSSGSQDYSPYIAAGATKQFPQIVPDVRAKTPTTILKEQKKRLSATPVAKDGVSRGVITVWPEETVALYALWLKMKEADIRKSNGLSETQEITPGQKLKLSFIKVSAAEFTNLRAEFAQETEEEFFAEYKVIGTRKYQVKSGDTLWDLCMDTFSIPLWLLEKYNTSIDLTSIHPGQRLVVPVVHKI